MIEIWSLDSGIKLEKKKKKKKTAAEIIRNSQIIMKNTISKAGKLF